MQNGNEKLEQINSFAVAEDWNNYVIKVHALKSTSLTIGATGLSELAKRLEFAGKEKDFATIKKENTKLIELYNEVIAEGKSLLEQRGIIFKE